MYVAAAEKHGVARARLGGTLQNDILKEYQAQKEFIFPPRPSMRLVRDTIASPRPRCRGGTRSRSPATTSARPARPPPRSWPSRWPTGSPTSRSAMPAGLDVDEFAPRLSFFFNAHIDFFEEIAKYRAARRIWARWMSERYGAERERSLQLRFHTQTAGVSLTAQQPEINIVRTAIEALAGVLGGTQSLHTNSMDEALALPTEKAARIALRTQQVIAHETGVANVADPLGGSCFVEALTDEIERQAEEIFATSTSSVTARCSRACIAGIDDDWFQRRIADAAYDLERTVNDGDRIVVGVNAFTEGNDDELELLRITNEDETRQRKRLDEVRRPQPGRSRRRSWPPAHRGRRPRGQPDADADRRLTRLRHPRRDDGRPGRRLRPPRRDPHHLMSGSPRPRPLATI